MYFCSIENARRAPSTTIAVYRTVSRSRYLASTKGSTYSSWCVPPLNPSLITPPPVSPSSHSGLTSCPAVFLLARHQRIVPSALVDNRRKGHWQMDNRKERRELSLRWLIPDRFSVHALSSDPVWIYRLIRRWLLTFSRREFLTPPPLFYIFPRVLRDTRSSSCVDSTSPRRSSSGTPTRCWYLKRNIPDGCQFCAVSAFS